MPTKTSKIDQIWPRVRPVTDKKGRTRYMVDTRLAGTNNGRLFFDTKAEAQTMAEQARIKRRNEGDSAFSISAGDRYDAESALGVLKAHGLTLKQAADFSVRHLAVVVAPKSIEEITSELLEKIRQDGKSREHIDNNRQLWRRFAAAHAGLSVGEVTTPMADRWLRSTPGISGQTRNAYAVRMSTFYAYAVKQGHALANPFKGIDKAKPQPKMPEILSLSETVNLLRAASPRFMPCVLLGLFAGLRPMSEICRLRWERIDFENRQIYIAPGCTKNMQSVRFVKMSEGLVEWLLPYRKASGPIIESRGIYHSLRGSEFARAGLSEQHPGIASRGQNWRIGGQRTSDILRHTFCSMYLAEHEDLQQAIHQMGHVGSELIFKHYRAIVTPQMAKAFWALRPTISNSLVRHGMTLPELAEEFHGATEHHNGPYLRGGFYICGRFCKAHADLAVADVRDTHVNDWLSTLNLTGKTPGTYKGALSLMFRYAVQQGYMLGNPANRQASGPFLDVAEPQDSKIVQMVA